VIKVIKWWDVQVINLIFLSDSDTTFKLNQFGI
jgi:hypothetical protein